MLLVADSKLDSCFLLVCDVFEKGMLSVYVAVLRESHVETWSFGSLAKVNVAASLHLLAYSVHEKKKKKKVSLVNFESLPCLDFEIERLA